ncbi:MAG: hypothetical protein ISS49_00345 [Anaerolineae bacterium]|nr:hypothetical protein [Anaerolineae bacterium]
MTAESLYDYFDQCISHLPPQARLALVLDPPGLLGLGEAVEVEGRRWIVFRYDGNDLVFRKIYGRHGPDSPCLVWITRPPGRLPSTWLRAGSATRPALDLSYLTDVVRRTDSILDLSLLGVLKTLKPREAWPPEAVARFEPLLAAHLGMVMEAHAGLRRTLGSAVPLDTHCLRALVLHALHPAIPVDDLTFRNPDPRQVLTRYLYGFITDYLAEIFTRLRRHNYQTHVAAHVDFGGMTGRNQDAVKKTTAGLLKLVFPHRTADDLQGDELGTCLTLATECRQRVLDQLAAMLPEEFGGVRVKVEIGERGEARQRLPQSTTGV